MKIETLNSPFNAQKLESTKEANSQKSFDDYKNFLKQKYKINSMSQIGGAPSSIDISEKFLKDSYINPQKQELLLRELDAFNNMDLSKFRGKLVSASLSIDDNGNVSATSVVVSKSDESEKSILEKSLEKLNEQKRILSASSTDELLNLALGDNKLSFKA